MGVQPTQSGALHRSWRWHSSGRRDWARKVVARNDPLNDVTHSDGATRSRGGHLLSNQELVIMEIAVGITVRQLLLHLHCASEFEAPCYANTSPSESLLVVPNYKFSTRLWLVGH